MILLYYRVDHKLQALEAHFKELDSIKDNLTQKFEDHSKTLANQGAQDELWKAVLSLKWVSNQKSVEFCGFMRACSGHSKTGFLNMVPTMRCEEITFSQAHSFKKDWFECWFTSHTVVHISESLTWQSLNNTEMDNVSTLPLKNLYYEWPEI